MSLRALHAEIVACTLCPRLRAHCADIAAVKRAAYRDESYWALPLPGFGDPAARLLVVGLAPGAHGANRTGRMFTGDRSGLFLMTAMHDAGFASIPRSESRRDGLALRDAWITAAVRCAPPDNKPTPQEFETCLPFLEREWAALPRVQVVVALGRLAWDVTWRVLADRGQGLRPRPSFGHGATVAAPQNGPRVIGAFHPSQQNTFTGRLTPEMLSRVFHEARAALS
ncbi:MAG: uracil-DNA glycosylase [Vicinamibacteraceae bacterium]